MQRRSRAIPRLLAALSRSIAACAVLASASPARAMPMPSPVENLVAEGQRKLDAGDLDGALEVAARAAKIAAKDPRPAMLRGLVLAKKKDTEGAIAAFRAAIAIAPAAETVAGARNEIGAALRDAGRLDEAVTELELAVKVDPQRAEAWWNLAQVEIDRGRAAQAAAACDKAMPLLPKNADVRIDCSIALRMAGKLDAALAAARESVSLAAQSAPAHANLGRVLQAAGKLDDAAGELSTATKLAPDSHVAWWTLGVVERSRKKYDASLTALEKARALKPVAGVLSDLVETQLAKGDAAAALALVKEAIVASPRSLTLRILEVRALAAAARCDDAKAASAALPDKGQAATKAAIAACAAPRNGKADKPGKPVTKKK